MCSIKELVWLGRLYDLSGLLARCSRSRLCASRIKNQQVKLIDKPNADVPGLLCLYSSQEAKNELRNGVRRTYLLRGGISGRLVLMPLCSPRLEVFQPWPAGRRPRHTGGFTSVIANASQEGRLSAVPNQSWRNAREEGKEPLAVEHSKLCNTWVNVSNAFLQEQFWFSHPSTVTFTLQMIYSWR